MNKTPGNTAHQCNAVGGELPHIGMTELRAGEMESPQNSVGGGPSPAWLRMPATERPDLGAIAAGADRQRGQSGGYACARGNRGSATLRDQMVLWPPVSRSSPAGTVKSAGATRVAWAGRCRSPRPRRRAAWPRSDGGRCLAGPSWRLPMLLDGPYTAVPITRKSPGHARVNCRGRSRIPASHRHGRGAGPVPSLSPWT